MASYADSDMDGFKRSRAMSEPVIATSTPWLTTSSVASSSSSSFPSNSNILPTQSSLTSSYTTDYLSSYPLLNTSDFSSDGNSDSMSFMIDKYSSIYNKNGRIGIYTKEVSLLPIYYIFDIINYM